jgi:adaptin ear-binding coat-associated protein 1/2
MWTGSCRVMSELGTKCKVQLVNEDGTIFAQSIITDGNNYETHVQRTYDSTRAFSLVLVSDKGEKATIGLIFPERNDSFDLVHALDEYKKAYRLDKGMDKHVEKKVVQKDFSLQEGEKMTLTIEGVTRKDSEPAKKK